MKRYLIIVGVLSVLVGAGGIYLVEVLRPQVKQQATLPTADTPDSRNQLRKLSLNSLTEALNSYIADKGSLPITIGTTPKAICSSITATCAKAKLVNLNFLTSSGTYLTSIPTDPVGGHAQYSTGFLVAKDPATGKIVISAPNAELGAVLSATTR